MTTESMADRVRLVTCRACGNRVRKGATRCAACGTPRSSLAGALGSGTPRPQRRRRRSTATIAAGAALAGVIVGAGLVLVTMRGVPSLTARPAPPAVGATSVPATTGAPPAPATRGAPAPAGPSAPSMTTPATGPTGGGGASRSRGRQDWSFFFRVGDRLNRMTDQQPIGVIVRTETRHAFADGTTGPGYVVRTPAGAEIVVDADELERGARVE